MSFASPTTIVSKLNALNNIKYNVGGGHDKLAEVSPSSRIIGDVGIVKMRLSAYTEFALLHFTRCRVNAVGKVLYVGLGFTVFHGPWNFEPGRGIWVLPRNFTVEYVFFLRNSSFLPRNLTLFIQTTFSCKMNSKYFCYKFVYVDFWFDGDG